MKIQAFASIELQTHYAEFLLSYECQVGSKGSQLHCELHTVELWTNRCIRNGKILCNDRNILLNA